MSAQLLYRNGVYWVREEEYQNLEHQLAEARVALAEVPKAAGPNFAINNPWMVRHAAVLNAALEAIEENTP